MNKNPFHREIGPIIKMEVFYHRDDGDDFSKLIQSLIPNHFYQSVVGGPANALSSTKSPDLKDFTKTVFLVDEAGAELIRGWIIKNQR